MSVVGMKALLLLSFVALVGSSTYTVGDPNALKSALGKVKGGDTIVISNTITISSSSQITAKSKLGSPSAPITIKGKDSRATLKAKKQNSGYCLFLQYCRYWVIQDLTCTGFLKGIVLEGSKYGYLSNILVTNVGTEAFKFRYYTHYWRVENCRADGTGKRSKTYGEGFYVGNAASNWKSGQKDSSGYITFQKCSTKNTYNDGWDIKEGAANVNIIDCSADFSGIAPKSGADKGYSGVYMRGDYVQVSKFDLVGGKSYHVAVKMYTTSSEIGGKCYGNNQEASDISLVKSSAKLFEVYKKFSCQTKTIYGKYSSSQLWADSKKTTTVKSSGFHQRKWSSDGVKTSSGTKYSSANEINESLFGAEMLVEPEEGLLNWEDFNTGDHGCMEGRKMGSVCCPVEGKCDKQDILTTRKMCAEHTAPCLLTPDEWEDDDVVPLWILTSVFGTLTVTGLALMVGLIKFFNRRNNNSSSEEYLEMNSVVLSDEEETM